MSSVQVTPTMPAKIDRMFTQLHGNILIRGQEELLQKLRNYKHETKEAITETTTHMGSDWLKTCHKQDKNFTDCSTIAVQGMFNKLRTGIPEVRLPPAEPLKIDKIEILQGDGPVSVNATVRDINVHGFGNANVLFNSVHPSNFDFHTRMNFPLLRIEGTYEMEGRILVLPMKGKGKCWFEPSNVSIIADTDADLYEKDGHYFYNVTGVHVDFQIGGLKLYMGNLFDGLKSLEQTTNEFLNTNWKVAADSLSSVLSATIESIIFNMLKTVFDQIPADFWVDDIAAYIYEPEACVIQGNLAQSVPSRKSTNPPSPDGFLNKGKRFVRIRLFVVYIEPVSGQLYLAGTVMFMKIAFLMTFRDVRHISGLTANTQLDLSHFLGYNSSTVYDIPNLLSRLQFK
ncbi:uncharacterized protein CBL_07036 [Carabus blaptoides fortunei]